MNIEIRLFDNFKGQKTKDKFTPTNERLFKDHMPRILESWGIYLKDYAEKSKNIFPAPEFPWLKFDEPAWVSSLAIAIARNYADAILVEELPVRKCSSQKGKPTDIGNADMWCCLNPSLEENSRFSFYLEAKFSSWARRQLVKHREYPKSINQIEQLRIMKLDEVHNQIANDEKKDNLFSKIFRDYQKSAGKSCNLKYYTTTSPHQKEKGRKHDHVFLTMIIKPVLWGTKWEEQVEFSDLFGEKVRAYIKKNESENHKPSSRNFYNFPSAGIIMRDKDGYGFIALILMLGETKTKKQINVVSCVPNLI